MKIALFGHGAMGQLVKRLSDEAGHDARFVPSSKEVARSEETIVAFLRGFDAAIDFTVADRVASNVEVCLNAGVPIVEGTTGWNSRLGEIEAKVRDENGAFVYGANFSIGVNLFYRIASNAAKLISEFETYDVFISEQHHKRKRDAPSGTAIVLKEAVNRFYATDIPVTSARAGYIPGTHEVCFDSAADQIVLKHTARSREGFASGALVAAEWISRRKGFYEFSQVVDDVLRNGGIAK